MKNLTKLFMLALLMITMFAYAKSPFPSYSKALDFNADCSADCTFSSCSGSGFCGCSCSWFRCKCSEVPKEELSAVSMNEIQYKKTRALANLLINTKDSKAEFAYENLVKMINFLKQKDYKSFYNEREVYYKNMQSLKDETKSKVSLFFEVLGAQERV